MCPDFPTFLFNQLSLFQFFPVLIVCILTVAKMAATIRERLNKITNKITDNVRGHALDQWLVLLLCREV